MSAYNNSKPRFLDQLVANQRLTADGRDWLVLSLDPFHDLNHQAAGFPDADGSQTIVSCYQYQTDITVPAGVVGNWDCHIFTSPLMRAGTFSSKVLSPDWSTLTPNAETATMGPLTILRCAAGGSLMPPVPAVATTVVSSLPAPGVNDLATGVTRIIGMGYEVTNTTAEINKQGSVTNYRMPQYTGKVANLIDCTLANERSSITIQTIRKPPSTLAQANLLKGTRTWDASSGVYATAVLNTAANPMMPMHTTAPMFLEASEDGGVSTVMLGPVTQVNNNAFPSASLATPVPNQLAPFDTTGSMFTGLSNATTLTVKVKFYVERAPTPTEANLCVLATPSAGYDLVALELYSHAISQLPVAVTVSENGLGDWFRGVVNVLKHVAGGATALLGGVVPGATEIGTAAQTILGRMDSFLGPKRPPPSVSSQAMSSSQPVPRGSQKNQIIQYVVKKNQKKNRAKNKPK